MHACIKLCPLSSYDLSVETDGCDNVENSKRTRYACTYVMILKMNSTLCCSVHCIIV